MLGVGGQGEQEYNNTRATNANAYEAEYMLREDSRSMKGARSRLDERAEFLDKEATEKKWDEQLRSSRIGGTQRIPKRMRERLKAECAKRGVSMNSVFLEDGEANGVVCIPHRAE